jgi:membrane protein YdbS with pleckstrin-like domain
VTREVERASAWIYEGVWASVVALFRVPEHAATLPAAGEPVRSLRPAPGYLRYLKFLFWVAFIPGDILPVLGWVAVFLALPPLGLLLIPVLVVVALGPDIVAYVGIHLRYDTTWYVLTDRSLRIRRGILTIHETTISFENVQNVEVRQGPVQRYFGIADVVVQTAGGGAAHAKGQHGASMGAHVGILQGLDDADAVRNQILACVERTRAAGLGDDVRVHAAAAAVAATMPGFSAAHLTVLRDIRNSVQRLAAPPAHRTS